MNHVNNLKGLSQFTRKDTNKRDENGMTPVHWAATYGNLEGLRILIGKGGNPDKPNNEGCTSLHLAAAAGQLHCLVFLTNFGGNVYAVNDKGETPMHSAANKGRINCVRHIEAIVTHQIAQDRNKVKKMQMRSKQEAEKRIKEKAKLLKKLDKDYERKTIKQRRALGIVDRTHSLPKKNRSSAYEEKKSKMNYSQLLGMKGDGSVSDEPLHDEMILSEISGDVLFENRFDRTSSDNDTDATETTHIATSKQSSSDFENSSRSSRKHKKAFPAPNVAASINSLNVMSNGYIQSEQALETDFNLLPDERQTTSLVVESVGNVPPSQRKGTPVGTVQLHMGSLYTFLHVLELDEFRSLFLREKIDLRACLLCDESDLRELGLPLGPRKIVLDAIKKRNRCINEARDLVDSAV